MNNVAMKFGGTSMGTAESITVAAEIVEKAMTADSAPVVVVSATSGTTDQLIEIGKKAVAGEDWEEIYQQLVKKHADICSQLGVEVDFGDEWGEIMQLAKGVSMLKELSLVTLDRLMTFGERMSSKILAALLHQKGIQAEAVDAFEIVFGDDNFSEANVNFERTNQAVRERVGQMTEEGVVPVVTGFVAQSSGGQYITLGRGGSDYTCAILGAALDAKEVQIWTDVDGILNADPRIVDGAKVLDQLSFNEAGELAYFGAKVLHPKTIKPAIEKNIPVKILNTFNPEAPGTVITQDEEESLKSVTYKKGISVVNVCSAGMLEARGFLAKLFEVFARYQVSVDVISTSEVSVSMTVDCDPSPEMLRELEEFCEVNVYSEMAIVCLVGEGIRSQGQVLGDLFSAVANFDVSMVSQGASKRNITFLVKEAEAQEVVKTVFERFFN